MRQPAWKAIGLVAPIAAILLLALVPFWLNPQSKFEGADGLAEGAIQEIAPGYKPWGKPLFDAPGGETQSLLFALQAAAGAAFLGYFFGWKRGSRRATGQLADPASPPDADAQSKTDHARS
jgi:cobalt/nickel transport protein